MSNDGAAAEKSRSVEDMHHVRLMALLHDLVRERALKGAAEALGVDPRTLASTMERGSLSGLVRAALERLLLAGGDGAEARRREQVQSLEQRVEGLEERLEAVEKGGQGPVEDGGGGGLGEMARRLDEGAQALEALARRVSRLEAGRGGSSDGGGNRAPQRAQSRASHSQFRPGVVTREPHPGEEDSYGPGMALVEEWRTLNRQRRDGAKLAQAKTRERIMELEIAMIGECELTLPPDAEPLRPNEREGYLGWRRRELADIRAERTRRELLRWTRRALTLGLWWK